MKLSIVIINWNDGKVLPDCLLSIFKETKDITYEVIISDNGSTDNSLDFVREKYPKVKIVENKKNLGFARGNNAGIFVAEGEYILILNPDTIVHENAFDLLIKVADKHPECGAFGCRVLNPDGSFQNPARPFPTIWRYSIAAFYLRILARISPVFYSDTYTGWDGTDERMIDWQSGCCILFRGNLLKELEGFDPRFFYHFEEVDLCYRVKKAGYQILYTPDSVITHLGGQSVGRFPIRFQLERIRNRYKYFHKHYGFKVTEMCRIITQISFRIRQIGYGFYRMFNKSEALKNRMEMYQVVIKWNSEIKIENFIENGLEPDVGYEPFILN